jgi:oligopeptide transport system permease protein
LGFFIVRLFPGSPLSEDLPLKTEVTVLWAKKMGLDQSLAQQFLSFLQSLPQILEQSSFSQFGVSAGQVFKEAFVVTAWLNFLSLSHVIFFGFGLAFLTQHLGLHRELELARLVVFSVPTLFLAPMMIWFFSFYLNFLPWQLGSFESFLLPVFLIALRPTLTLARMVSQKLAEFHRSQPAQVHLSMGFSHDRVIFYWGFKEALKPLVSQLPHFTASILSGSFLIEALFSARGLGALFIDSLGQRDLPVLLVLILFYTVIVLVAQMISDLILAFIDPRAAL